MSFLNREGLGSAGGKAGFFFGAGFLGVYRPDSIEEDLAEAADLAEGLGRGAAPLAGRSGLMPAALTTLAQRSKSVFK